MNEINSSQRVGDNEGFAKLADNESDAGHLRLPAAVPNAATAPAHKPLGATTWGALRDQSARATSYQNQISAFCIAFLADLIETSNTDDRQLTIPLLKVINADGEAYLVTATAKFTKECGAGQFGMAIDGYLPAEHPLAVRAMNGGVLVRSNRNRRLCADPKHLFWVRAMKLVERAKVRFSFTPYTGPGGPEGLDVVTYYEVLEDGTINGLTGAQYRSDDL